MSKLLIPNTCQVPNVLLDNVMPQLSGVALKILLAIVRQTYGFNLPSRCIGLTELQRMTGLSRPSVVAAIRGLGDLITIKRGPKNSRVQNEYGLNIDISTGQLVKEFDQLKNLTSQKIDERLVKKVNSLKPIRVKPNTDAADAAFEQVWTLYPKRAGGNSKKNAHAKWGARVRAGVDPAELVAGVERYAAYIKATGKEGSIYVKQTDTFFGPGEHWKEEWRVPGNGASHGGFVG